MCDACGGALHRRADDSEETILNRLKVYEAQTASLIDYYRARGVLATVNGAGDFLSSVIVGALWSAFGTAVAFGYSFLLFLAGAGLALTIADRTKTA